MLRGDVMDLMAGSEYHLPPCPTSPNCVSSQATDDHFIAPFSISGDAKSAFDRLREVLAQRTGTTVVSADDREIRVEFRTVMGFIDDGLFVLDAANRVILIRAASRLGYWDLGKNRRRMEEIRQQYMKCMEGTY